VPNRIFVITFTFFSLFIIGVISFAQSQFFGRIVSENSSRLIKREYGVSLSFERFKLSLFPLKTTLVNVDVAYNKNTAELGELSVEFGLEDLFANDLSIGELKISHGLIYLKEGRREKNKKISLEDLNTKIRKVLPMKVRRVGLERVKVFYKKDLYDLSRFYVELQKDKLHFFGRNILRKKYWDIFLPKSLKNLEKLNLDEVTYDFYLEKNVLTFNELVFKSEDDFVSFQGILRNLKDFDQCFWEMNLNLARYNNFITPLIKNADLEMGGDAYVKGQLSGSIKNPKVISEIEIEDFKSKFIDMKKAFATLSYSDNIITIQKVNGKLFSGQFESQDSFILLDLRKPEINISPIFLLDDIKAKDILKAVPALKGLGFGISGKTKIKFTKKSIRVDFLDNNSFEKLALTKKKLLFKVDQGIIKKMSWLEASYKGDFKTNLQVNDNKTQLKIDGVIQKGIINIAYNGKLDFNSLKKIADVPIRGFGSVRGDVSGHINDATLRFELDQEDVSVLKYYLGKAKALIKYDLGKNKLVISKLSGQNESLKYVGEAFFQFVDKEYFKIRLSNIKGSLNDLFTSTEPILKKITEVKNKYNIFSQIKGHVVVEGKFQASEIEANGFFKASDVSILGEDIKLLQTPFQYKNEKISFIKIKGKKGGPLLGSFSFDTSNKYISYNVSLGDAKLKDFYYFRLLDLGLSSKIRVKAKGSGPIDNIESKADVKFYDSYVSNKKLKNSDLAISLKKKNITFDGDFIDEDITLKGNVDFSEGRLKRSRVIASLNVDDLRKYFGILSIHNLKNETLSGKVKGTIDTDFTLNDLSSLNLSSYLNDFKFKYENINIDINEEPLFVIINNGRVKNWNIDLLDRNFSLRSVAKGKVEKDFDVVTSISLDASILELLSSKVGRSQGSLVGKANLKSSNGSFIQNAKLSGELLYICRK